MLAMWLDSFVVSAALCITVQAQIRILSPESLKSQFSSSDGVINGGTAVFGAPYYGEHVLGHLRGTQLRIDPGSFHSSGAKDDHCSEEDYSFEPLAGGTVETQGERMHDILVLEHGTWCTACKKVRVAQAKGVKAVILVDQTGDSDKQVQEKILGDDGFGQEVKIPSILVSRATGDKLFAAMRQETVVVELAWDIPQSQVVSVDFWWSSGAKDSQEFLMRFAESAEVLSFKMQFTPRYYVFDVSDSMSSAMGGLCADRITSYNTRHCAPDPDGAGPITGADVANEDVRQLCLWHKTSAAPDPVVDAPYSAAWWAYVSRIYAFCPFEEEVASNRFGSRECSYRVMKSLNINTDIIDQCVRHHADKYLEESAKSVAWSEQALRINGWRYSGALDPEIVLKAICSGYATPTPACEELLNGWLRRTMMLLRHRATKALMSEDTFGFLMGAIGFLTVINAYLYRGYIKRFLKKQMREEVMLEVQSQMSDYAKLEGTGI